MARQLIKVDRPFRARSADNGTELLFRAAWTLWCEVDQRGPEIAFEVENFEYHVDRATFERSCKLLTPPATAET
jgi:hypothetical protein